MLSNLLKFFSDVSVKRICLALMLSILLHFSFIQGFNFTLPSKESAISLVEVRLVELPKPIAVEPPPAKPPVVVPKKTPIKPNKPKPPVEDKVSKPVVTEPAPPADVNAQTPIEQPILPTESTASLVEPQPELLETSTEQATTVAGEELAQISGDGEKIVPYKLVKMQFDVTRGIAGMHIGVAQIQYGVTQEGTYEITSIMEPDFIASLIIKGKLIQSSKGLFLEQGLKPQSYDYQFAKQADKTYRAEFDWEKNKLTMHTSKGQSVAELSTGAQDLLSFMFQFMFVPPLQEMDLAITNGRKFKIYSYSFEGEELLKTKAGEFRTLHIMNASGDEQEKTELWLAIDYRNLPVRIRKTEKDGKVIEQVITNLATESLI